MSDQVGGGRGGGGPETARLVPPSRARPGSAWPCCGLAAAGQPLGFSCWGKRRGEQAEAGVGGRNWPAASAALEGWMTPKGKVFLGLLWVASLASEAAITFQSLP